MNSQNGQRTDTIWYTWAEDVSREVFDALSSDLRDCLASLAVTLDPYPSPDEELQAGDDTALLGLFVGTPFGESLESADPLPCAIRLFIENLRDEAGDDPVKFKHEVRTTLLHEIGHYLGLEEDDLVARGLA